MLKRKSDVVNGFKDRVQTLYRTKRLLELSIRCISNSSDNQSLAIPFRLIEVFTTPETYGAAFDGTCSTTILSSIWSFLVNRCAYFSKIRAILDKRVPEPYEPSTKPPTPLAASLMELIERPLNLQIDDDAIKSVVVRKFFSELVVGPFSAQVKYFVLPCLLSKTPKNLNGDAVMSSIITDHNLEIPESVWTLYAFVKLIAPQASTFNNANKKRYLDAMRRLSVTFPEATESSDEDSEVETMDVDEDIPPYQQIPRLVAEVIEVVNEPNHVNFLLSMVDYQELSSETLTSLCKLCYALLACDKLAVNKYR